MSVRRTGAGISYASGGYNSEIPKSMDIYIYIYIAEATKRKKKRKMKMGKKRKVGS